MSEDTVRRYASAVLGLAGAHVTLRPPQLRRKVVTVTGAAGQIGYAALFRIGAGALLGRGVPVTLRLLELPSAVRAAEGVVMELVDSAFELLAGIEIHDDPVRAFDGVDVALLIGGEAAQQGHGARRPAGRQRGDLRRRGPRAERGRVRRRPDRGRRQPGQHQRPGRVGPCARHPRRAVHRADAARPQPGGRRSWPPTRAYTSPTCPR